MFDIRISLEKISLTFGKVQALQGIDSDIRRGEILAVIGPNGAGKTCLLNCISGFYRPEEGEVYFDGKQITRLPTHQIARMGIGRTFQNIMLYTGLSVQDNLMAGRHPLCRSGLWECLLYFGRCHREEIRQRKIVEDIIDFLELAPVRKKTVGSLSYGLRKRVDLGRALASEPQVLLLDEPMAGMNREEKEDIGRFILDLPEERNIHSIVLIEHDMGLVMDISDRVIVLDYGRKIAEGTPGEIKCNPAVVKAYLGEAT